MELLIHIGTNKTASSNIQNFCQQNRHELLRHGIYYPETGTSSIGAHHFLGAQLLNFKIKHFSPKISFEDFEKLFFAELRNVKFPTSDSAVLISSEMLFDYRRIELTKLRRIMSRFSRVSVLVYLRRQDTYLPSFYNSKVRNGDKTDSLEEFVENYDVDYLQNLELWSKIVGKENIRARPFLRRYLKRQDIFEDFIDFCGINLTKPVVNSFSVSQSEQSGNESIPYPLVEILRVINNESISVNERAKFVTKLREFYANDRYEGMLSQNAFATIKRRFSVSNQELEQKFFDSGFQGSLAFPDQYDSLSVSPVTKRQLIDCLVGVWNSRGFVDL